jgi:hypothetical protein
VVNCIEYGEIGEQAECSVHKMCKRRIIFGSWLKHILALLTDTLRCYGFVGITKVPQPSGWKEPLYLL